MALRAGRVVERSRVWRRALALASAALLLTTDAGGATGTGAAEKGYSVVRKEPSMVIANK